MGYLSVISVRHDMQETIKQSRCFGAAIDNGTGSRQKNIVLGSKVVGNVLRTANANQRVELMVDALQQGLLSLAWVYHDELDTVAADPCFGTNFVDVMRRLPEMETEKRLSVEAHANGSSCTGGYVFFTIAPGYRVRVLMHGNLAEVCSYIVVR